MSFYLYSFLSVFLVTIISLVGVFTFYSKEEKVKKIITLLVSLAVGGLLGNAFLHLIPESFRELGNELLVSLLVLIGIFLFFILEKFIRWRHCHIKTSEKHVHPVALMNIIGDGVHNLIDGIAIGISYSVNTSLGIATTLAVILHEIPQELGDFGILINSGFSFKKALFFNFLTALTSFLGLLAVMILGETAKFFSLIFLPIIAGGFIYVASSDLIPELHNHKCEVRASESLTQLGGIFLGLILMILLSLLK